jgi:positive regulator of sigma E activity
VAEREAIVVACAAGELHLQPLAGPCSGCSTGCGGRCDLFRADLAGELRLPEPPGLRLRPGDRVLLSLDDDALRRAAFAGYGHALAGLLLGAVAGHGLALAGGWPHDPLTLAGIVAGTWVALRRARRMVPVPRLRLVSAAAGPTSEERSSR